MDLDQRAIEIRPRTAWEACDLGIQMGRHWWWPMVKIWLALAAPWLLLSWLVPARFAMLPLFFFWLGKPLWERFLLHFLSQAIFASELKVRQILKLARQLLAEDWLASILWRRFSPWRAYNSAVTVLEEQTGKARRQRLKHLEGENASHAAKVAVLLMHIEGFLLLSVLVIAYALTPEALDWNITQLDELTSNDRFAAAYNTLYILLSAAVAPFFVATGFALYLNRRIWLEAWDIEISFKTLAKRLSNTSALMAICVCLWFSPHCAPVAVAAEQSNQTPAASLQATEQYNDSALNELGNPAALFAELHPPQGLTANFPAEQLQIEAILATEVFHQKHTELKHHLRWKWKFPKKRNSADRQFWENLFSIVAKVLEVLLWTMVLALIFWLALNYRKLLNRFTEVGLRGKTAPSPMVAFGLDLRPANLPDNVDAVALKHCQAGEFRQGLALLYRATLVALVQKGLTLKPSFTEEDCLAQAGSGQLQLAPPMLEYLRQLTTHWQSLAYGHQNPPSALAEDLCLRWRGLWQPGDTKHV